MATKLKESQTEEELVEAFNIFDNLGKGHFGKTELRDISNRLKCKFTDEEIDEMIAVADTNGDQTIDFEEFVKIMLTNEWLSTK